MLWTFRCEINYRYLIEECASEGGRLLSPVTVSVNDGTLTSSTMPYSKRIVNVVPWTFVGNAGQLS